MNIILILNLMNKNNAFTCFFDKDQEIILYPQDILVISGQINYGNLPGTISNSHPGGSNLEEVNGLAQFGCSWIENI